MAASVPDDTMRTISIDGINCVISSASCVSSSVGAPKVAPARHRFGDSLHDARMRVAKDKRAPGATVIEIAVAIDVEEVRACAARDKDRLPADAAEGARGTIDAARNELAGLGECGGAFSAIHFVPNPCFLLSLVFLAFHGVTLGHGE